MPRPRARDLSLYKLHTSNAGFVITKFDRIGFEVLSQYELLRIDGLDEYSCPCPQGLKPSCRHRKMLPMMVEAADTERLFCYDTGQWQEPRQHLAAPAGTRSEQSEPIVEGVAKTPIEGTEAEAAGPTSDPQRVDTSRLVSGGPITQADLQPLHTAGGPKLRRRI